MNTSHLFPNNSLLHGIFRLGLLTFALGWFHPAHAEFWQAGKPAPGARASHSAVWTGREMIVWGGGIDGQFLQTGGRYLPATDTWRATSTSNAPSPRWFHAAVWTAREMLVWGGRSSFDMVANHNDGGRYNPETDRWQPLSTHGAPNARSQCAAVWTGKELIVWGGVGEGGGELNDGAAYDPETDTWRAISGASGLEPRMEPTGVWTGSELIVYGGMKFSGGEIAFGNGARYRPITDTWTPLPEAYSIAARTGHTAVWTGERMLVWGGRDLQPEQVLQNNGAIYEPGANRWTPVQGHPDLPGRMYHAAVWTGTEMIVWGGMDVSGTMFSSGARYQPATGLWTPTASEGAAAKRHFWRPDLGVWTGEAMLIAAGADYPLSLDSTFLYYPEGEPHPGVQTNCIAAPSGLIAWWRAEGNAQDSTGSHDGSLLNGGSFAPGRVGRAFSFDGAGSRVSIPDSPAFQLTHSLSFEGWVRADSLAPGILFFRGDNRPGLDPYHMSIDVGGHLHWGINAADNNFAAVDSPEEFPVGEWTHVAGVLDDGNGQLALYINGGLVRETTTSLRAFAELDPGSEPAVGIGNHGGTFHNFPFHGRIDEWSLYSRPLNADEVRAIYQAGVGGKCVGPQPPHPPNSFELSADFSASANPAGLWSYGYLETLNGEFALLTFPKSFGAENGVLISAWQYSDTEGPTVNRVMGDQTAVSEGGAFTAEPGTVYVWPGTPGAPGKFGVIRLTLPAAASRFYRLETAVRPTFDGPVAGDTDFHVLLNGHEVFGRFLGPSAGADFSTNLALAGGDHLDFVVGAGADGVQEHSSLKVRALLTPTDGPPSTNCVTRPAGLVGWWRGEGNANDNSGEGNGIASGGVTYEEGMVGQAFRIDGASGRVNVADEEAFKLVDALSIEAWVKLVNRLDGLSLMMRGDDRPGLDPYFMGVGGGNLAFGISDDVDSDYASTPMVLNRWLHVAGTFDAANGSIKLYVDGVLRAEKHTTRRPARDLDPNFSPGIGIGNVQGSWINFPWDGWLDEVSLYNRALTADEIQGIYEAGAKGKCATPEPPHPGPFDLSAGFSANSNPAGAWSYGYLATLDGPFTPLTFHKSFAAENGALISAWQLSDTEGPSVNRVMGDQTAVSEGGAFTAAPGTVYVWPGSPGSPGQFGVVRLTLPPGSNGLYQLETVVRPTFDGPVAGDTDFHVLRNGHELFGRFLGPNVSADYSTILPLAGGDQIDFVVGRGGDGSADHSSLKVQARLTRAVSPPVTNHCLPAPAGIAAWWPFDGNAMDVVSGQSLQLSNAVYRPAMVRQGLSFRGLLGGSNTQERLPASPALDVGAGDGFAIETWVNPSLVVMQPLVEWRLTSDASNGHFGVHFWIGVFGSGTLYANVPDISGTEHRVQSEAGLVKANAYQHVGMSYEKTSGLVRLYLNGHKVAESFVGTFTPATRSDLLIGYRSNLERLTGVLDELAIYRRALSDAEFASIAAAGAGGKCPLPPSPPAQVYDLASGFSLAANPNGPWTYGSMTGLDGALVRLDRSSQFTSDNGVPIGIWSLAGHKPWVAKVLGFNVAESDGDHFSAPPGTVYFGPEPDQPHNFGVIRFTVPEGAGGLYALDAFVQSLYDGTRSVDADFHVLKNRQELFVLDLPPLSHAGYTNILLLAPGDFIDFAAGPGSGEPDTGLKIRARLWPLTNAPTLELLADLAAAASVEVEPATLQAGLDAVRTSLASGFVLSALHQLQELRSHVQPALALAAEGAGNPLALATQQLIESLDPSGARRSALATLAAAAPVLQTVTRQSSREVRVEARAVPGASCLLERSADLRFWSSAGVPTEVAEGVFRYIDSSPALSRRFYRLKLQ